MRENLGVKSFQQALIQHELQIICKVLREIYTPCSRGEGVQTGGTDRSDVRHIEPGALLTDSTSSGRDGFRCGPTGRNCSVFDIPSIPLRSMPPPCGRRPVRDGPALGHSHFLRLRRGWPLIGVLLHVFIVRVARKMICKRHVRRRRPARWRRRIRSRAGGW